MGEYGKPAGCRFTGRSGSGWTYISDHCRTERPVTWFSGSFLRNTGSIVTFKNVPFILTIAVVLLAGVATGFFNAWMVNKIKLEAFIATLVTQNIMRGFAYIICDGKPVSISNKAYLTIGKARLLTIPVSVWLMILAFVILDLSLQRLNLDVAYMQSVEVRRQQDLQV